MSIPYRGGQCIGQAYNATGTITLTRIADGSKKTYECVAEDAPGQLTRIPGPIVDVAPSSSLGEASQGDTYYIAVVGRQGNFAPCGPTVQIPFDRYIFESAQATITPADSFQDNCGNNPDPIPQTPSNPPPGEPFCPVPVRANSDFEVHSGAVTETVDLVTYQSLGETRGVSLYYNSLTADPRPILHTRYSQVYNPYQTLIALLTIRRGTFTYNVPGYPQAEFGLTPRSNFWSVPVVGDPAYNNGIIDAALQADLRTQPSGQYQYTWRRSIQYIDTAAPAFTALGAAETGNFIHINRVNSSFGAGWALVGWQELIANPDNSLLLLDGDGTQLLFKAPATVGNPYTSPTGDFSRLEKLADNTYRRTLTDRTIYTFDAQGKLTGITDRNNNLTQYVYNLSGQLTQIVDPVNLITTFTYTGTRVTQIKDPANRITQLDYNATGDLIKLTHPDNAIWQWEYQEHRMSASIDPRTHRAETRYDSFGRATEATRRDGSIVKITPVAVRGLFPANQTNNFLTPPAAYRWPDAQGSSPGAVYTDGNNNPLYIQVDARGSAVSYADAIGPMGSYQYNAQNLVQVQTNGRGQATNYNYDSKGNVTQTTDTLSGPNAQQYTYDPTYSQLATMTDELGRQTIYDIDPANGNIRSMNQAVGAVGGTDDQVTRYSYTAKGQLSSQTDALNRITSYLYNTQGRLYRVTLAQGTADQSVLNYGNNSSGTIATATDARGNQTKFFYDPFNRLIRVEEPDPDGTGPQTGPITRYTYDANGNLTQVQDAKGNLTKYEYDALNRLTKVIQPDPDGTGPQTGPVTTYQYDPVGNLRFVTDPLNHITEYQYDARNRLKKLIDPRQGQIQFEYDLDNNVTAVIDPVNNRTTFSHDARNRLISEVNALNKTRSYGYNAVNNLTSRTDRNNRVINFEYDDLNRLTKEIWTNTTQQINYSYDLVGNLKTITDLYSSLTYTYDNQDRPKTIDNTGTPNFPVVLLNQTYDPASNRLTLSDTINTQLKGTENYTYDPLNRLTQITQTGTGVSAKRVDMTYNPLYQMESLKRYTDLAGTQLVASSTYSYDLMNRLTQLAHLQGVTNLNTYGYSYDAASRITQMSSIDGTTAFTYDNTDQLTLADHSFQNDEAYFYDLNGNRTNAGYQTTTNNRLQSDTSFNNYVYDDEGNLLRRTQVSTGNVAELTWDYRNRLTQYLSKNSAGAVIRQVNYTYDALNRRIEKRIDLDGAGPGGTTVQRLVYDRDHIKLVFDGSNNLIRRYLHGPNIDQILAEETNTAQVYWLLSDHQGSVRDLVSSAGAVLNHIRYNSFGRITSQSGTTTTRFYYTGREWDAEIGLYFYRARYYDPLAGRFIGEDPIGFAARDVNLYRYVGNHSTRYTDPYGLQRGMHSSEYQELEDICTFGKCGEILGAIDRIKDSIYFREGDIQCGLMAGGNKAEKAPGHWERVDKEDALLEMCTHRANTVCDEKLKPKNQPKPGKKPPKPCDSQPQTNPKPVPSLKPKPQRPTPSINFPNIELPKIDIPWIWPLIRQIFGGQEA